MQLKPAISIMTKDLQSILFLPSFPDNIYTLWFKNLAILKYKSTTFMQIRSHMI